MTNSDARSRPSRASRPPREMDASAFATILEALIVRIPGAHGAVLVDAEGEAVDYAGYADTFELRVCAAHLKILLAEIERSPALGAPRSLVIRCVKRTFVAHALPEGYAVVVLLGRRAGFAPAPRALSVCERALRREAGWSGTPLMRPWFEAHVTCGARSRPLTVRSNSPTAVVDLPLEIMGRLIGLSRAERGYRARLASGAELTLVREPGGHWYSDEDLDAPPEKR